MVVPYDIPGTANLLSESFTGETSPSVGDTNGLDNFGSSGYGAPCRASGSPHRYVFKIFAFGCR